MQVSEASFLQVAFPYEVPALREGIRNGNVIQ